jgi:hypothetical protein
VLGWPDLQLELSHILLDCLTSHVIDDAAIARIEQLPERHLKEPIL